MYQQYLRGERVTSPEEVLAAVVARAEVAQGLRDSAKPKRHRSKVSQEKADERAAKLQRKEGEKQAKKVEAERLVEEQKKIDTVVLHFQTSYYKCIKVQQEKHPTRKKGGVDDTDYTVAKWFTTKNGRLNFDDFNHNQLRQLCLNCNIKGGGNMSMWKARIELASWVSAGTIYNENNIANPFTTAQEKRVNTYMRIINVCFHPSLVQRFIDLNDRKKREDYKAAGGGNPFKDFFTEASHLCNDSLSNHEISVFVSSREVARGETNTYMNGAPSWASTSTILIRKLT
jgi:hypothetical protein